jgi:hypothetical protein
MYSPNIIRASKSRGMSWEVHVARVTEMRHAYRILVGKPEGKEPLRRPRRRWDDKVKVDLQGMGSESYTRFIRLRIGRGDVLLKTR